MKELTWVGVLLTFMVCVGCERHAPDLPRGMSRPLLNLVG